MAICRSHLFSQIVNSVGGITYFYNRFGSIICRNRTTPTNPSTVYQQTVRAIWASAVTRWQSLTVSQRDAWEVYARTCPRPNSLGDVVFLTGFNLYCAVFTAHLYGYPATAHSSFDTAPCTPGFLTTPLITQFPLNNPPGAIGIRLKMLNQNPSNRVFCSAWISPSQSLSVNFYKNPYDPTNFQVSGWVNPLAFSWFSWIGLTLGTRYFFRFRLSQVNPRGRISDYHYFHCEPNQAPS